MPETGRTFRVAYTVRLSDTDATGRLRLDAIARYLQDAANDDVQEMGWGAPEHLWVLRSVRIDVLTPSLEDRRVGIVTWGSSFSALAWRPDVEPLPGSTCGPRAPTPAAAARRPPWLRRSRAGR